MTGFLNKTFWGGKKHKAGLAVAASPVSISASGIGPVNSAAMTATATGGTAPYTYSWALQPGSHGITITSPTAKTTATSATLSSGDFLVAFAVCTVTDNVGAVVASNQVSIQYTATSVPTGNAVLTRTLTNLSGSSLPAVAFWTFGHPFAPKEVPAGSIVTASLNGTNIPITGIASKYHADGSLAWAQILADFSGVSMGAGTSQTLSLPIVSGSWSTTTARTNSNWSALVDTVELTNLTTTSTSHPDMDKAGTWIAAFDAGGTNTIETYGSGPQGLFVSVKATLVNTGTTHAYLMARMEYWVCQKQDGTLGPIASRGPFIENVQVMKSNGFAIDPGQFTYDCNWKRNGSSQRSQLQIPNCAGTYAVMCRYDGQWDWTATDPQIGVTQSYALTRKTLKMPPFLDGITYTGGGNSTPNNSITGINTSTGLFTIGSIYNIIGLSNTPVAVGFTAASMPTGLSADPAIYWVSYVSNTTFFIYDSFAHATAGGSTGKVIPSTTGTSVVVRLSVAPMHPGVYTQYMPSGGARNDISLLSEWGSAYHVGNAPDFQRLARVMAYAKSGIQVGVLNDSTGKVPNFGNASIVGLGTPMPTTHLSSLGTGGSNNWTPDTGHWPGAVNYAVWLMEGGTILRDWLLMEGNMSIWSAGYLAQRNLVISGTTYYASVLFTYGGTSVRYGAWDLRAMAYAAFAAGNGSPEEAYYRGVMSDNCSEWVAYMAYKGGNFGNLGLVYYNENDYPPAGRSFNSEGLPVEGFMQSYLGIATAVSATLHGDFVSGLNTVADYCAKWNVGLYNSAFAAYFSTVYVVGPTVEESGGSSPGTYRASLATLGLGTTDNMFFDFGSGSGTITVEGGFAPPPWPLAAGDKYRPQNYPCLSTGIGANSAPSPFVDGTDSAITSVGSGTFNVATAAGSTVTGVGGWFLPTGQGSPSSGTLVGDHTSGDSYLMYQIAGLGTQAVYGATGASAAWTNAYGRFTGGTAAFAGQCMWAFQDSI